ncbi:MAG: 4Fe-4S ferredoxin [Caldiserica bacterium]|nr:MAG: 4Fe-4S ferredoxin [Caldisericota bacterium]
MKLPKLRELKEAIRAIFSSPYTITYPEKPPKIHPRFRGRPKPQDGCVACGACSIWCPAQAIEFFVDKEKGIRKVIFHYDKCIMCGECARICTTQNGVKMDTEFRLAGFERKNLKEDGKECKILFCEGCGEIIATEEHIKWMLEKLGEKQGANFGLFSTKLKDLGVIEDVNRNITFDKRDDIFTLLCPKCRHRVILHDSK